jgi:N-acyl-D-aspartate/D-glutamate deacylase
MTTQTYDTVIIGGRYFDGTGAASSVQNIGIKNGSIARVTTDTLSLEGNPRIIDAAGKWVTPGFLDTHTHYDAEVLVTPSLSESVRHGVTTVLVGSCSLSMICSDAEDASDIFTRVETVPREKVLPILKAKKALTPMQTGQLLKVVSTDKGSLRDFAAFAKQTGNELLSQETVGDEFVHVLKRR